MQIKLSDHFTYKKLFKFTLSPIVMMIITSIYSIVDGLFISNFVGDTAFSAVNFIFPVIMVLSAIGFMIGTGGSALVSKNLGEGHNKKANELFSMFIYMSIIIGVIFTIFGIIFLEDLAYIMGARGEILTECVKYATILLLSLPFYILQLEFQNFFVVAEKPNLGLLVTIVSGVFNMILDAVLIIGFNMDVQGAALATAISQFLGAITGILFFAFNKNTTIKLTKFSLDVKNFIKGCYNGISELLSNVSMSLVGILYNIQLLNMLGENGVSAYGVLMYVNLIFLSIFIGISMGCAPVISYNFGALNHYELKNVLKKCLVVIISSSILMVFVSILLAKPLSYIFVGHTPELFELTIHAFYIYSFSFLFAGISIFGSSFFTALNNGLVSAIISFLRTLVFQVAAILLLPLIFEVDGIWISIVFAEFMAALIVTIFMITNRKKYHY